MDGSKRNTTVSEAIFGIVIIFGIFLFLIYRFGSNNDTVSNEELNNANFDTNLLNENGDNGVYNKYIEQIYDAQQVGTNTNVDSIITEYQKELESKVKIPTQSFTLQYVSSSFSPKVYAQNFELIYEDLKKNGGGNESKIFNAQITDGNTLLSLSDYDKETILRLATEYELFAGKLTRLSTPLALQKKVEEIGSSSLNIAYILRKMIAENDQKIYSLWISKYAENMSAIITIRYALQQ